MQRIGTKLSGQRRRELKKNDFFNDCQLVNENDAYINAIGQPDSNAVMAVTREVLMNMQFSDYEDKLSENQQEVRWDTAAKRNATRTANQAESGSTTTQTRPHLPLRRTVIQPESSSPNPLKDKNLERLPLNCNSDEDLKRLYPDLGDLDSNHCARYFLVEYNKKDTQFRLSVKRSIARVTLCAFQISRWTGLQESSIEENRKKFEQTLWRTAAALAVCFMTTSQKEFRQKLEAVLRNPEAKDKLKKLAKVEAGFFPVKWTQVFYITTKDMAVLLSSSELFIRKMTVGQYNFKADTWTIDDLKNRKDPNDNSRSILDRDMSQLLKVMTTETTADNEETKVTWSDVYLWGTDLTQYDARRASLQDRFRALRKLTVEESSKRR